MHGSASPEPRERLLALDVFRGLTVASMLLVNNPGSWGAIYAPLEHAEWHGWTPTDLIFPFFLFIVGITTHLSKKEPKRIVRRGLTIVLLGLLLNAFPFYWWGKMAGVANPTLLDRVVWRFEHLRFAGVLQRIGVCYIAAALIALYATRRQILITIGALLIGYWILMTCVPVPGSGVLGAFVLDQPDKTLSAWFDRAILGTNHIWVSTKTWDPEGPLSTLPAIATALVGVLAGEWLTRRDKPLPQRVLVLYGVGSLGVIVGKFWDWVFPINKNLWTSSYVVFAAGFACIALATCLWLIDVENVRGWTKPFVIYGVNPMAAFVGSGLMARLIDSLIKLPTDDGMKSLHAITFSWINLALFSPKFASLLWGLGFVAFWLAILGLMHRRGLILKV